MTSGFKSLVRAASFLAALLTVGVANGMEPAKPKEATNLAVGLEGGTTGLGISGWFTLSPKFVLHGGYAGISGSQDYSTDGIDYDGSADLSNAFALLQWYPQEGHFHLTAGAVFSENQIGVTGRPESGTTYEVGGVNYPASMVGQINGDVSWGNSVAPYIGLGWAKTPESTGAGVFLELGAMFSGSAEANLIATGPIANDPDFLEDLRQEEDDVNEELGKFEVYPVIRLGVMYRF